MLCNLFITKAVDKLLSEMLCELAHSIEDALPGSAWQDSCQSLLPAIVARRSGHSRQPLDCDVIQQLRSLQSVSLIRTAKSLNRATRALQLGLHAGDDKTECLESKRVAISCRRAFTGSTIYCFSADATRFGGKHWLASIIGCTQKKICTFANPVVQ